MTGITEATVSNYLSSRLGAPVSVTNLKRTFPGASRVTYLVWAEVAGRPEGFSLRVDPHGGSLCPFPMRHEWTVYERLWGSDVPVPEPLWYDEGQDFAEGRPHMVRRLVDGTTAIPNLYEPGAEGDRLRRSVAFECAEKLAIVHRMDWQARGFGDVIPTPTSASDAASADLRLWRDMWRRDAPKPWPLLDEAFAWLGENVPTDCPRISLVKGNNGVGEEIWRDGRIVALCDWELAGLSDGAFDLAFSQGTLNLTNLDDVLKHYGDCVGHPVSPQRLAFAHFFILLKQCICGYAYIYGPLLKGNRREAYMASLSATSPRILGQRLVKCLGKDLVDAYRIVNADNESSIYRSMGDEK